MESPVEVRALSIEQARGRLAECARVSGFTVRELAQPDAFAFELRTADGHGVFVLEHLTRERRMWIAAAAADSASQCLAETGLTLIEGIARHVGCSHVAFETKRPGLSVKAHRLGYRLESVRRDSIIMKKDVTHGQ